MRCFDILNIEYKIGNHYIHTLDEDYEGAYNEEGYLLDFNLPDTMRICVKEGDNWSHTEEAIRKQINNIEELYANDVKVVDFTAFYEGTDKPLRGNYEDYDTHGEYAFMQAETFEAREKKIGSITIKKNPNFPSGTHLQGYIKTNRAELRKVFGNPNMGESGDGKSKGKEWNLIVGPHRVTIYDYREKDKKGTKYFNIGGDNKYGALLVAQALSLHRNEKVHAIEISPAWDKEKFDYARGMKFPDSHDILTYERAKEYEDNRMRYRAETAKDGDMMSKRWAVYHTTIPQEWLDANRRPSGGYPHHEPTLDIKFQFYDDERVAFDPQYYEKVATATFNEGYDGGLLWRLTNNVDESWSREFVLPNTFEWGEMKREKPLHIDEKGEEWGLRSSMVGDIFHDLENDEMWIVAPFGFEKVHNPQNKTFNVEFNEWADQEMMTHGKDISFKDWAEDEGMKHGNVPITEWAQHEEESHDARYGAEGFRTIGGRGFQIEFKNGYKISIMFGDGNYGDHYNNPDFDYENSKEFLESSQAELAILKPDGQIMLDVFGWVSPDFVAALIPVVATGDEAEMIEVIQNREHREAEEWNWGGDPEGQLATALRKARIKLKKPRKPLKIEKLDAETSDYQKLEYIHSTLQDCDGDDVMIETSLGFVEDLREPYFNAETSGQWEIGEQLEEAQMNAETFEGIPQSVSDLEAVEDVRCDKYEMEVNFENEDIVIVSGEELKAIMDDGWDLDSVRSFAGAGMSLLFTRNPNRAFHAEDKKRKKISGLLSDPFDELSLDSGGMKSVVVGLGIGLLACFGYSKWK